MPDLVRQPVQLLCATSRRREMAGTWSCCKRVASICWLCSCERTASSSLRAAVSPSLHIFVCARKVSTRASACTRASDAPLASCTHVRLIWGRHWHSGLIESRFLTKNHFSSKLRRPSKNFNIDVLPYLLHHGPVLKKHHDLEFIIIVLDFKIWIFRSYRTKKLALIDAIVQ